MKQHSIFDNQHTNLIPIFSSYDTEANIILYPGDVNKFLESVPDQSVRLIITSPPYNLGKEYEDEVAIDEYLQTQEATIKELYRVLSEDGSICWQVGNYIKKGEVYPLDIFYYRIFKNLGMQLRNRIVWRFGHGLHASKRFSGRYETLLWFSKTDNYMFSLDPVRIPSKYPGKRHYKGPKKGEISGNPRGKNPSDVWEIMQSEWETSFWEIPNVKSNHPEKTQHPCQFPIELVERCVLAFTNEGDWVFDPYAGVGSSLVGAIKHNRKAMGAEKERVYVDIAAQRVNDFQKGILQSRPLGKPVHVPSGTEKVSQVPEEWRSQDTPYKEN